MQVETVQRRPTGAKQGCQPKCEPVKKCFVPTCDSKMGSICRRKNITFHNFPKNKFLFLKWKKLIQNENDPCDTSRVCSLHFKEEDYRCPSLGKQGMFLLKADAAPSLRLPVRLRIDSRQTRYQTRLATAPTKTEPTDPTETRIRVEDTGGETSEDEEGPFKPNEDGTKDAAPEPSGRDAGRRRRRKLESSSKKAKNRPKRRRTTAPSKPRRVTSDDGPPDKSVALEIEDADTSRVVPPFVLVGGGTGGGTTRKRKPKAAATQKCCVPGCTTQHKSVFSFPTEPSWHDRWSKSIFGTRPLSGLEKPLSENVPLYRTVSRTDKDGSKVFVHSRRQLKIPMAAYRALFTIPGLGQQGAKDVARQRALTKKSFMVCSAHFQDGKPTAKNPVPKLNLGSMAKVEAEWEEVRPRVHEDHTYATLVVSIQTQATAGQQSSTLVPPRLPTPPTPPKQSTDVMPAMRGTSDACRDDRPGLPTPPSSDVASPEGKEETVIRRRGESQVAQKPEEPQGGEKAGHRDHTYAIIAERDDFEKGDHTYAFVISEVKNSESAIWGQYSVSPLAQACYTTGPTDTFTEDQDLFYATVKQEAEEVEDDFELTPTPLVSDRCFASDWELPPTGDGCVRSIKREPPDTDPFAPDDTGTGVTIKREPDECGSFHFVDVSNFMNDYRSDFEDLGSLDS